MFPVRAETYKGLFNPYGFLVIVEFIYGIISACTRRAKGIDMMHGQNGVLSITMNK